jgi:hypothetical protein
MIFVAQQSSRIEREPLVDGKKILGIKINDLKCMYENYKYFMCNIWTRKCEGPHSSYVLLLTPVVM